jgi:hypothetical protein
MSLCHSVCATWKILPGVRPSIDLFYVKQLTQVTELRGIRDYDVAKYLTSHYSDLCNYM